MRLKWWDTRLRISFILSVSVVIFILPFHTNSFSIYPEPLDDPVLERYRWCLADPRGGIYLNSLKDVSCIYVNNTSNGALQDVKCKWSGVPTVEIVYQVGLSLSNNNDITANCSAVRQVKALQSGEFSDIQLDHERGLNRVFPPPASYMYWRTWLPNTSPLKIILRGLNEPLPSLRNYTHLQSLTFSDSAQQYPKVPGRYESHILYALPPLPTSLKDLTLENNDLRKFPYPNNNTFPMLKRLSIARNRLSTTHLESDTNYKDFAPSLEELDFSYNVISYMMESDFEPFPMLKKLNMAHNKIRFSFQYTVFPKTLKYLNISYNREISELTSPDNKEVFPELEVLDISYTMPLVNQTIAFSSTTPKLKSLIISGYDNYHLTNFTLDFLKMNVQNEIIPLISNSKITTLDFSHGKVNRFRNLGMNNMEAIYLNLSHNEIDSWNDESLFEAEGAFTWILSLNLSYNKIKIMNQEMLSSLQLLRSIDLGANPFECNNCSISVLQGWLPFHKSHVINLNRRHTPLMCESPSSMRMIPVTDTTFFDSFCIDNTASLTAIPAVIVLLFIVVQAFLIYRYRLQIIYMFHVYRLRVRGIQDNAEGCTHDVFVCYSSMDRSFVMDTLAPFLEEQGPESYKAYVHERSFTLGSDINTNIVEAIEKSRHALLVVSQAFLKSEYCKKEFNMVTHRAFDGNPGYMVMLRYGSLRKEEIPRNLRMYMTTTTYLEWPENVSDVEKLEVRKRLVKALGRSLHQRALSDAQDLQKAEQKTHDNVDLISDIKNSNNFNMILYRQEIDNNSPVNAIAQR